MDFLDLFFPKKCINCKAFGDYICSDCFILFDFNVPLICGVCGRQAVSGLTHPLCKSRYNINGIFVSLVYKGITKKLVYQFKFQPYLKDLRFVIGELFYDGLIQQEAFVAIIKNDACLVPIPLHTKRLRERGYNQAEILSVDISRKLEVPVLKLLQRGINTTTQVGKTQGQRRENIKDAFLSPTKSSIKGKTIFLIDDIVTSGATMNEAAKVLKRAGAKDVYGLALAHGL